MTQANTREQLRQIEGKLFAGRLVSRAIFRTLRDEIRSGTLLETIQESRKHKTLAFPYEPTYAELLETRARENPSRPFLRFENQRIDLLDFNRSANAVAKGLRSLGAQPGDVCAIMSGNCPEFLYSFFATQKLGMGAVPVNTGLMGDGLTYLLDHSQARFLIVHRANLEQIFSVRKKLKHVKEIIVITEGASDTPLPRALPRVEDFLHTYSNAPDPRVGINPESVSLLLYTSGTTGHPKGVVYKYRDSNTRKMRLLGNLLYDKGEVLYTCLPLFHANALLLSTMQSLNMGHELALGRKFSASRFWEEVSNLGGTTFNTLGAMIPILLKQPPGPYDRKHSVRVVVSAACPANAWREYEDRFGVRLIEAYAAVDGGGFLTLNMGNAPVGSIGKPLGGGRYRLVAENGAEAGPNEPGELQVWKGKSRDSQVEYYRNEEATKKKTSDGWLRTGDLLTRDEKGYLYFVGRNTDSMRRRGENVSAYEVETVINKHPDVLESAVFGIPSELGEDDIMAMIVPIEGRKVDPAAVHKFLQGKLAKYAIPRFIEVTDELPKTGTHRVQKNDLRARGPSAATWDADKAAPKRKTGAA
ncbi:MAG: AMP-binding protein [Chrysiogenetes bacterium]|nr:AMP-binding protein [Chrysiogenetes bacterium]